MKILFVVLILCIFWNEGRSQSVLPNLLDTDFHECITCVCHARSGCFSRINCARYSISHSYWKKAGSPSGNYNSCMRDENCILHTIKGYVDYFGQRDCNCDGSHNCEDVLSLHLAGENCSDSLQKKMTERYNTCARKYDLPSYTQRYCEEPR